MINKNKIDWQKGMDITSKTFIELEEYHKFLHEIARNFITADSYGLFPKVKFEISTSINDSILTIDRIFCKAITKNGVIIITEEGSTINLPTTIHTGIFFITIKALREKKIVINDVPYLIPEYEYEFKEKEDLTNHDLFPILKINRNFDQWEVLDYVPPCYCISSNRILIQKFEDIRTLCNSMLGIIEKKYEDNKGNLLTLSFLELNSFTKNEKPSDLTRVLKKIVQCMLFCEDDFDIGASEFINNTHDHYDIWDSVNSAYGLLKKFEETLYLEKVEKEVEEPPPPPIVNSEEDDVIEI
jgi:hypothetical protein